LTSHRHLISTYLPLLFALVALISFSGQTAKAEKPTLAVVVMDPLAAPLACDCVQGYAQRKYEVLAASLEDQLGVQVELAFAEGLESGLRQTEGKADLVIGKDSVVRFDAKTLKLPLVPVAALTGTDGKTTQFGLFVVPKDDPAQSTGDLKGYTILFGPVEADEKHVAAIAALKKAGVPLPKKPEMRSACSDGALEILEEDFPGGGAAVISSYAKPLLEGCGTIDPGELRAIGKTDPVPFVVAFVRSDLDKTLKKGITKLLLSVGDDPELKTALETKSGFLPLEKKVTPTNAGEDASATSDKPRDDWPCFRGPNRDAIVPWLPQELPAKPKVAWTTNLSSPALAGVVATDELVIVADRSFDDSNDIWLCLDAKTGEEKWKIEYQARGDLDYGNSPRATPLIDGDRVFLVGAFGDVHCVKLADGEIIWKKNACIEFGVKPLTWGMCHSPIIVDGKLILGPGAPEASVVALDPKNGDTIWKTPGRAAAYASFVDAKLGGVRQLVGYDSTTAGGWDIATGKRLWELVPEEEGDFNVPTPIVIGKQLYLTSENNGSRLYDFDDQGKIVTQHTAHHWDLAPDTATPVVVENRIYGCWGGEMFCLDAADNLETLWTGEDDGYIDHVSLFAGSGRILVASAEGELLLVAEKTDGYELISRAKLFDGSEVLSHPALVGKQLFIRDGVSIRCVLLDEEPCVTEADKPEDAKPDEEPCITDESKATDFKQPRRMWASSYLWAKAPELVVEEWLTDKPDTKGKYVLIEFWATWCPPCRRSLPLLNGFHEKFGDELVVIGISHETAKDVLALNDKYPDSAKIRFYSAIDTKARMKKKLGVWGIPHAILLEPDGYVIWEGFPLLKDYELTEDIINRALEIGRKLKAEKG